jgi:hypothetical protein
VIDVPDKLSPVEEAERLGRRRARMLPVLAVIFIAQQASFFASENEASANHVRTVDQVKVGAWVVLSAVLLAALYTGGFWLRPKAVRALMDDEITRAHRASALSLGFLVTMIGAIGLYFVDMVEPMQSRVAIHLIVTFGIAAALVRFGMLERRVHAIG